MMRSAIGRRRLREVARRAAIGRRRLGEVARRAGLTGCLLLAGLGALAGGCADVGGVCVQAEVDAGLTLAVHDATGPGEHPGPGMYTFTLTTEFGALTWMCAVAADDGTAVGCAADHELGGENDTALLVSAVAASEEFRLVLVRLESNVWTGPESVHVEIERDGDLVADETYAPKYEYSPLSGGRGCPQYWVLAGDRPTIELAALDGA